MWNLANLIDFDDSFFNNHRKQDYDMCKPSFLMALLTWIVQCQETKKNIFFDSDSSLAILA
jgi:hypothetical protein